MITHVKIYTKQGDQGYTVLYDGQRVPKNHPRIEVCGHLDELNGMLGLAIVACRHTVLKDVLVRLQHQIFNLGSDVATPLGTMGAATIRRIDETHAAGLEREIDAATEALPPLKVFILPGGGATAAHLQVARAIARRAERALVTLTVTETLGPAPLIYLNRLSDLLFMLARLANKFDGIADVAWDAAGG